MSEKLEALGIRWRMAEEGFVKRQFVINPPYRSLTEL